MNQSSTAISLSADAKLRLSLPQFLDLKMALPRLPLTYRGEGFPLALLGQRLHFHRKPVNLDALAECNNGPFPVAPMVFGMIELFPALFDRFAAHLTTSQPWLLDAWEAGYRQVLSSLDKAQHERLCVIVTAPERPVLFVDTQGADYARYVALLPGVVFTPEPGSMADWAEKAMGDRTWENSPPAVIEALRGVGASLGFETMESRNSDRLDFRELSVWGVRDALLKAYSLGFKEAEVASA